MPGHAILIGWGSSGDVFPMIGVGRALLDRGHHVTLVTNDHFQSPIEHAGITFRGLGTAAMYHQTLSNPDIWHPRKGFKAVAQLSQQFLQPMYDLTHELLDDAGSASGSASGGVVVAGTTLALGARVAREVRDFPLASVHLQPSVMLSLDEPPVLMSGLPRLARLPRFARRMFYSLMHRQIDSVMGPAVNNFRATLGLPPVRRMYDRWWHSPDAILGLWPQWFAPPAPDWPPNITLTGFARYDAPGIAPIVSEGRRGQFIAPAETSILPGAIVFTPGSANRHAHRFFLAAVDACIRLQRPGILLTQFPEHLPSTLPPLVRHMSYAPLQDLLAHCAAIVHHAGIGTTAASLAAGVPQILMPLAHDQPDNAARIEKLGTGVTLPPNRFTGPNLAAQLAGLLDNPRITARCRAVAATLAHENGCQAAADQLESMMRPARPLNPSFG
ncbi:MAG: glycosyltransferase [Phycisphaerales bacterium]